jgi:DHA1 family bicyclomycin/chloramphenicol resistance-like MFS transporter
MNQKTNKEFIFLMAFLTSIMAFAIDAILPALDQISADLNFEHITDSQYLISSIFLGFGIGLFLFGPLSDAYGRKKPVYVGAFIFISGCIISLLADNFNIMILGRLLQGLGASAFRIISLAIIRDQYSGPPMAKITSLVMTIFILVPVIAPSIGQFFLYTYSWKSIFYLFLIMCLITNLWFSFRQKETLAMNKRNPLNPRFIIKASLETLTTPITFISILISGLIFGAFIGYLSSSQMIFQRIYDVGDSFPIYFGSLALTVGISSFINSILVQKYGLLKLVNIAMKLMVVSLLPLTFYLFYTGNNPPLWILMLNLSFLFFFVGLLFGNLNAMAITPLGHIAGVASSVIGAVQNIISVMISILIVKEIELSILPLILGFLLVSSISSLILNLAIKSKFIVD